TPGGNIADEKIKQMISILGEYLSIANKNGCEQIIAVATNAFRIAANKDEILKLIRDRFNLNIKVISGEEESHLAYLGAVSDLSKEVSTLVIDIGGGSTEIIMGKGREINYRKSFLTGVVSATEKYLLKDPPSQIELNNFQNSLQKTFNELSEQKFNIQNAIAIAGTPTTLACIKHNLAEYDEVKIEGSNLKITELEALSNLLSKLSSQEILTKFKIVVRGREDVLLAGTVILFHIMRALNLSEVKVSTKGIRYGAILKYINP